MHRLVRTLDDARRSPVADAVAAAWGYPAGTARHVRSSAGHVFTVRTPGGQPDDPLWLRQLRRKLAEHIRRQRDMALAE
ncbi:MAG TPA: hypothetical protein VH352_10040 [Pseudonocardiaceae bacterium]|nr:hypothetical protein [Pseudonocardiaceae bacterium]